jgi:DNA-binding transcriptional MerR regulator
MQGVLMIDENERKLVKIGELARAVGVTTRTVRFYEDLGLIEPARRSRGGFRLYGADQADRLRAVLALKKVGFSLEEIRDAKELVDETVRAPDVNAGLRQRAEVGVKRLRKLIAQVEGVLDDLRRSEKLLADCQKCDKLFDEKCDKLFDGQCREHWAEKADGEIPDFLKAVM